jgi:hypothetical protein
MADGLAIEKGDQEQESDQLLQFKETAEEVRGGGAPLAGQPQGAWSCLPPRLHTPAQLTAFLADRRRPTPAPIAAPQRRLRSAVFLRESIPWWLGPAGYAGLAVLSTAFIPMVGPGVEWAARQAQGWGRHGAAHGLQQRARPSTVESPSLAPKNPLSQPPQIGPLCLCACLPVPPKVYTPVKWYYVLVAYLVTPLFALPNSYGCGLTDWDMVRPGWGWGVGVRRGGPGKRGGCRGCAGMAGPTACCCACACACAPGQPPTQPPAPPTAPADPPPRAPCTPSSRSSSSPHGPASRWGHGAGGGPRASPRLLQASSRCARQPLRHTCSRTPGLPPPRATVSSSASASAASCSPPPAAPRRSWATSARGTSASRRRAPCLARSSWASSSARCSRRSRSCSSTRPARWMGGGRAWRWQGVQAFLSC